MERRSPRVAVVVILAAAAIYFVLLWVLSSGLGIPAFDIYQYYYPNMLYAVGTLADGARGFLWNQFQNCGQPFLGISSTGFLYPGNVFFLLLDPDTALRAVTIFNLAVAGISAYMLCRELGTGVPAAVAGALTFQLANTTVDLVTWSPMVSSPYVWIAAAMLFCERTLRAPRVRNAAGLAVALGIALLPGFPQPVFFTYQLIALRVLWEFLTRRVAAPFRTLGYLAMGLGLPPLLTAAHFFPSVEMAQLSVRGGPLTKDEIKGAGYLQWASFRTVVTQRREIFNPFLLAPFVVAGTGVFRSSIRRVAAFYLLAGGLYFVLGFGPDTPLYDLYLALPFGRLFRDPFRFFWVTGFCLPIAAAFGVEAIARSSATDSWLDRAGMILVPAVSLAAFRALRLSTMFPQEWIIGGVAVGAALVAVTMPRSSRVAAVAAALAVSINALAFPLVINGKPVYGFWSMRLLPTRQLLPSGRILSTYADAIDALGQYMTPQERLYLFNMHPGFELEPKVASLQRVPSILDYEPQPTRRSAEYWVMMRSGRNMKSLNDYYIGAGLVPQQWLNRHLLDLAAARYILVDPRFDPKEAAQMLGLRLLSTIDGLRIYENPNVLPRAFYVPRLEVMPNSVALLQRLAVGSDDPRQVTLVEEDPPSGFHGVPGNQAHGSVQFVTNDPERVVLRVEAPERGFLFLADQYFPGWRATVNGALSPIARANYLFRAVEVPAGESIVEFHYLPSSLRLGVLVSVISILGLAVLWWRDRNQ